MNADEARTAKRLAFVAIFELVILAYIVWVEVSGYEGDHATISDIFRLAWAYEPGAFLVVTNILTYCAGVLTAHFFWAGRATYDELTKR